MAFCLVSCSVQEISQNETKCSSTLHINDCFFFFLWELFNLERDWLEILRAPVPNYFDIVQSGCIILETGFLGITAIPKYDRHDYILRHMLDAPCTFVQHNIRDVLGQARTHTCI